jgi:hypothetical protein
LLSEYFEFLNNCGVTSVYDLGKFAVGHAGDPVSPTILVKAARFRARIQFRYDTNSILWPTFFGRQLAEARMWRVWGSPYKLLVPLPPVPLLAVSQATEVLWYFDHFKTERKGSVNTDHELDVVSGSKLSLSPKGR